MVSREEVPSFVADVVARIPLWRDVPVHVAPLSGVISLNNANYQVTAEEETYVLRIAAPTAHLLGIRRDHERRAAQAASLAGIAPDLLYFDESGNMVTRFLSGRHWQQSDFRNPAQQVRLARTLRQLHGITATSTDGSLFRRIKHLTASIRQLGQVLPADFAEPQDKLRRIEARRACDTRRAASLCHNDLWANNLLDDGDNLWLLDWEFAGEGDPLVDLATLSLQAEFDAVEKAAFLTVCGYDQPEDVVSLESMIFAVKFFEALWALVQQGVNRVGRIPGSDKTFDYAAHARQCFETLRDPIYNSL